MVYAMKTDLEENSLDAGRLERRLSQWYLSVSELEVGRDDPSVETSLSFIPMPGTNPFSLLWGCTEVDLIYSHPQRVRNVGTSKEPLAVPEMDLLDFWIHKYLSNSDYVPRFRVGEYDRGKINRNPCSHRDHIQVGGSTGMIHCTSNIDNMLEGNGCYRES